MYKTIVFLYHRIHLNLGIKRGISALWSLFDTTVVYPIVTFFSYYLIQRVMYYYGADYRYYGDEKSQNIDKKTANLGYGLIHYSLLRNMRPQRVLCIGSMYGFIPFLCALACQHNRKGTVDFVDAGYDIKNPNDAGKHNFGQGFWKKINPQKHFSFLGTNANITTYIMRTEEFAKKYPQRTYDFIYVDGDHNYRGVKKDYAMFWPRLNKGGFMVFHDTTRAGQYLDINFGVWKIWKEIKSRKKSWIEFPNESSGLGIVQKN